MKQLIILGRGMYSAALVVYGVQQLYFGTFRDVFFSVYQKHLPLLSIFSYIFGVYLIATGVLILIAKKGESAALSLGVALMVLFLGTHLSYELISEPNKLHHLGLWTTPLKEVALAGGAFVVAYSFEGSKGCLCNFLSKMMPYGNLLFVYVMASFGVAHLIYGPFLADTVPATMANHEFWVYVTGVCLLLSSLSIVLGIRIRAVALLLSLMIFIWVWVVHVPGTLSRPLEADRGNLLASAFDALAFSGTALLIGLTMKRQKWIEDLEAWGYQNDSIGHPINNDYQG